jgi:chemotaxis family two-component system sensor kinase Cph1
VLAVTWELDRSTDEVRMQWAESGGPSVGEPRHTGFGRLLLERALASDLNGEVKLSFAKEGLRCLISFPLDRHSGARARAGAAARQDAAASPEPDYATAVHADIESQTRVLVVEDEALLAMELEELLDRAGCTVVGPFSDVARALDAAHRESIDVALLDMNLNGEMVYPLADELTKKGVPFLFVTGYGALDVPERFRSITRVAKPIDPAALANELQRHSSGRAGQAH